MLRHRVDFAALGDSLAEDTFGCYIQLSNCRPEIFNIFLTFKKIREIGPYNTSAGRATAESKWGDVGVPTRARGVKGGVAVHVAAVDDVAPVAAAGFVHVGLARGTAFAFRYKRLGTFGLRTDDLVADDNSPKITQSLAFQPQNSRPRGYLLQEHILHDSCVAFHWLPSSWIWSSYKHLVAYSLATSGSSSPLRSFKNPGILSRSLRENLGLHSVGAVTPEISPSRT